MQGRTLPRQELHSMVLASHKVRPCPRGTNTM
jgi:hypothetical protein